MYKRQASEGLIQKLENVIKKRFKRVSYTEAIDILKNSKENKKGKFQFPIEEWGADLQSEHERYLVEKHFESPVVLFDYPKEIKAFYMKPVSYTHLDVYKRQLQKQKELKSHKLNKFFTEIDGDASDCVSFLLDW